MSFKNGIVFSAGNDGWAEVITDKLDACANCVSARNCASTCKSTRITTRVLNEAGAKEGDLVAIYMSSSSVLKSAALLYLIPVACLILGAIVGNGLGDRLSMTESNSAIVFSLAGFVFGFVFLAVFSRKHAGMRRLTPIITHIVVPADEPIRSSAAIQADCSAGGCHG